MNLLIEEDVNLSELNFTAEVKPDKQIFTGRGEIEQCRERGQVFEILCTVCPDYSHNEKGTFLFDGEIGVGAGLVAKTIVRSLIPTLQTIREYGVHSKITLAYADQEAFDAEILATLRNISSAEFLNRINQSKQAGLNYAMRQIRANGLDHHVQLDVIGMSERFPVIDYDTITEQPIRKFESLYKGNISYIALERAKLISRMFGSHVSIMDRTLIDIYDHIVIGDTLRQERESGKFVAIASMSIPHLSNTFNYNSNGTLVPRFHIGNNY